MKTNYWCFIYFLSGALLVSCSPMYYVPTTHNVPSFREKGEFRMSGTLNLEYDLFTGQAAYALTEHIGLQANIMSGRYQENYGDQGTGKLSELGVGYFNALSRHFSFECYGLMAGGRVENQFIAHQDFYDSDAHGSITAKITRYGLQPSITFITQYFEAAISPRISHLGYSDIEGNLTYDGLSEIQYLESNHSSYLFEPALTLRAGVENVKVQLQFSNSYNITHPNFRQRDYSQNLGLWIRF